MLFATTVMRVSDIHANNSSTKHNLARDHRRRRNISPSLLWMSHMQIYLREQMGFCNQEKDSFLNPSTNNENIANTSTFVVKGDLSKLAPRHLKRKRATIQDD
ncbi:hypothetical protein H5410_063883 [Solanum commersonii]|uniref:Uncharacterized protein n=1 Tax=Solanum commersonii TaxID=4109 RepID=A0A9J5WF59_SOLCO|nr:hypothetical protein H5410_063883 [Solanum commersonii]